MKSIQTQINTAQITCSILESSALASLFLEVFETIHCLTQSYNFLGLTASAFVSAILYRFNNLVWISDECNNAGSINLCRSRPILLNSCLVPFHQFSNSLLSLATQPLFTSTVGALLSSWWPTPGPVQTGSNSWLWKQPQCSRLTW